MMSSSIRVGLIGLRVALILGLSLDIIMANETKMPKITTKLTTDIKLTTNYYKNELSTDHSPKNPPQSNFDLGLANPRGG